MIARKWPAPPPQLADWELPLFEQVTPNAPAAQPAVPDRLVDPGNGEPFRRDAAARLAELAR